MKTLILQNKKQEAVTCARTWKTQYSRDDDLGNILQSVVFGVSGNNRFWNAWPEIFLIRLE